MWSFIQVSVTEVRIGVSGRIPKKQKKENLKTKESKKCLRIQK